MIELTFQQNDKKTVESFESAEQAIAHITDMYKDSPERLSNKDYKLKTLIGINGDGAKEVAEHATALAQEA